MFDQDILIPPPVPYEDVRRNYAPRHARIRGRHAMRRARFFDDSVVVGSFAVGVIVFALFAVGMIALMASS